MSDHPSSTPPNSDPSSEQETAENAFAFAAGNPLEPPLSSYSPAPGADAAEQADEDDSRTEFDPLQPAEVEITRTLEDTAWMDMRVSGRLGLAEADAEPVQEDGEFSPDQLAVEKQGLLAGEALDSAENFVQTENDAHDDGHNDGHNDGTLTYENWAQTLEPAPLDLDELLASVSTYSGSVYTAEDSDGDEEVDGNLEEDGEEFSPDQPARRRGSKPTGEVFTPAPYTPAIPLPGFTRLRRGSIGAFIPAFGLIALGAWMTFTLTSGGVLDNRLIALAIVAIVVLSLLAQWIGSRRWARGSLFLALLLAGSAALLVFSLQPGGLDLLRAYPLLFGILGLALIGAGTLGRPGIRRVVLPGFLLLIVAAVGLAYNLGYIPTLVITPALPFWPGVVGLVLLLLILPLLAALPRRRRSPDARTDLPRASGARVRS